MSKITTNRIEQMIYIIRDQKVMLDSDLAPPIIQRWV
jgi:hypothetical protein